MRSKFMTQAGGLAWEVTDESGGVRFGWIIISYKPWSLDLDQLVKPVEVGPETDVSASFITKLPAVSPVMNCIMQIDWAIINNAEKFPACRYTLLSNYKQTIQPHTISDTEYFPI